MNLSQMRVAIRPMSTSQAVDLGTMIARHWFVPLWKIWMGMALPFFIVLYLPFLLYDAMQGTDTDTIMTVSLLGTFLFWWGKPLYEKPMVTWLGHALFNEEPDVKTTIKTGLKQAKNYGFTLLVKKRLSPSRQLILPILQLEKPNKQQLKQRQQVLLRGQGGGLTWHTLILINLEIFIAFAIMLLILALMPTSFMTMETYFDYLSYSSRWEDVFFAVVYVLIASIIAPFFIASGFAVYLTKRCLLEGWDIELIFKNLASRYQSEQANPLYGAAHANLQQKTLAGSMSQKDGINQPNDINSKDNTNQPNVTSQSTATGQHNA